MAGMNHSRRHTMTTLAPASARCRGAARYVLPTAALLALLCALPPVLAVAPMSLPATDAHGRIVVSPAEQAHRGLHLFTVPASAAGADATSAATSAASMNRAATVRAAPGAGWLVTAQLEGRLVPPPDGFPVPGHRIEAGQPLAYLIPTPTLSQRSRLAAEQAEAERDLAITRLKLEQFELSRGGRGSIMEDPSSPTLLPQLEAEREGGEKRKQALEQGYSSRSVIFSARDGVLLGAPLIQGRIVRAGDPLFELYDARQLWLELPGGADACATAADPVAAGPELQAVTSDGHWLALRCVATAPVLSAASVVTRLAIVEGGDGLSPGTRLSIRLQPASTEGCVTLPPTAFAPAQDGWAGVWVRSGISHFTARRVPITQQSEAGACAGRLLPGEQVVTAGLPPPAMAVTKPDAPSQSPSQTLSQLPSESH